MRAAAEGIVAFLSMAVLFYIVTVLVANAFGARFYWAYVAAVVVVIVAGSFAVSANPQASGILFFILLAALWCLLWSCLLLSPNGRGMAYSLLLPGLMVLGVPLGLGSVRTLMGALKGPKGIVVSAAFGALTAAPLTLALHQLNPGAINVLMPIPQIATVDLVGFDLLPFPPSADIVRKTLRSETVSETSGASGAFFLLGLILQALQSAMAALWDAVVLWLAMLLAMSPVKLLMMR